MSKFSILCDCAIVYAFLSFINLRVKLSLTPSWFNGTLSHNHTRLLAFEYTNNEQSRLAQYGIPELFVQAFGCHVETAYIIQRWVFVAVAFVCFHLYLRKWFSEAFCFLNVVLLAAVMPLTYMDHLQESAPLLMVTFLLGLWAIRENRLGTFSLLLLVGAINNETMLILPLVVALWRVREWRFVSVLKAIGVAILTAIPAYSFTAAVRYATRDNPHLGHRFQLPDNLRGILTDLVEWPIHYWHSEHLLFLFMFGSLWVLPFVKFRDKPRFLRRASMMVPVFIAAHMITGRIAEPRQMIPLASIILPMALLSIFPEATRSATDTCRDNGPSEQ